MEFQKFTLKTTSMVQANINNGTYFFTINHITKEADNKLIYGIRLNNNNYFLSKTSGIEDGVQLDIKTPLSTDVLKELNAVITAVELKHNRRPSLEQINNEIFSILIKLRSFKLNPLKTAIV